MNPDARAIRFMVLTLIAALFVCALVASLIKQPLAY
jgi:hypothetical protein